MWRSQLLLAKIDADANKEYESKDGMQSAIFGPPFWLTIHITSFNYPTHPTEDQKKQYSTWLWSYGNILPCKYCRENFSQNMKNAGFNFEETMKSRHSFSRFCYDLHDVVNTMLKKTSPPFEQIREQYEAFRAKCLSETQKKVMENMQMEKGCIRPHHNGKAAKCLIKIVPKESEEENFQIAKECCPRLF